MTRRLSMPILLVAILILMTWSLCRGLGGGQAAPEDSGERRAVAKRSGQPVLEGVLQKSIIRQDEKNVVIAARSKFVVIDHGSGQPVSGVPVRVVSGDDSSVSHISDDAGQIQLEVEFASVKSISAEEPWRGISHVATVAADGVYCVTRDFSLTVRLVPDPRSDASEESLDWSSCRVIVRGGSDLQEIEFPLDPLNRRSLAYALAHKLHNLADRRSPKSGDLELRLPRVPFMTVYCTGPGLRSDVVPVRVGETGTVELVVRRRSRTMIRVVAPTEGFVFGDRDYVSLDHTWIGEADRLSIAMLPISGGFGVHTTKDGRIVARSSAQHQLKNSATMEFESYADAESKIRVLVEGFYPEYLDVTQGSNLKSIPVELRRVQNPSTIRFTRGGVSIPRVAPLAVHDVTDPNRQLTFVLFARANGVVSSDWMEEGHDYGFHVAQRADPSKVEPMVFLKWRGDTEVDLVRLPSNFDEFKKNM